MQSSASPALTQSTNSYNGWAVDGEFSVYVGNLDPDTSLQDAEELLYELFLQAGPLTKVYVPFNGDANKHKGYGLVEFQHTESVTYSLKLMAGLRLCGRVLNLQPMQQGSSNTSDANRTENPFKSALQTHVAQKKAELVAANPFLNSLNSHCGGPPLPPPPPLPPLPPAGAPLRPPGFPPPILPFFLPPRLPPPPPLLPPFHPPDNPASVHSSSIPLLFPPQPRAYPPLPLMAVTDNSTSQSSTLPPVPLFGMAPPPHGEQIPDPTLSFEKAVTDMSSCNGVNPNSTLSLEQANTNMPTSNCMDQNTLLSLEQTFADAGMAASKYAEQNTSLALEQTFADAGLAASKYAEQNTSLALEQTFADAGVAASKYAEQNTSLALEQTFADAGMAASKYAEQNTSLALEQTFADAGMAASKYAEQNTLEQTTVDIPASTNVDQNPFEQAIADMGASNCMVRNGTSSTPTNVRNKHLLDACPMSLQLCLSGQDGLSSYPPDAPYNDHDQTSMARYQSNGHSHGESFMNGREWDDSDLIRDHMQLDVPFSDGPSHPPPDVPVNDHSKPLSQLLRGLLANNLHQSRLGANDHPAWMSEQVRQNIQNHHLNELQDTIGRLKEAIMKSR